MKLNFKGKIDHLHKGIELLSGELGYESSPDGIVVHVERIERNALEVIRKKSEVVIRYNRRIHFFRALGLLVESSFIHDEFEVFEEPQFDLNGIMPDISQGNAIPNTKTVKEILNRMAVMGLNMLMLYMEDSYIIAEEPYFGYMRGKYSQSELKDLDDYAEAFGIELIPSIQTLAHLKDVLKWKCYSNIEEDDDTLLVGEPKTYEFIEKMIKAASAPFRTKRIHIGMDEAWKLGLGEYLKRNGLKNKNEIMLEHLGMVAKITEKYGLKPMMWSDMFFRTENLSGYGDNYDPNAAIPEYVKESMPKPLDMVFWEYNKDDEEFYRKVIKKHKEFGRNPIFAGGIWNWMGFGVNYGLTFRTTNAALHVCKREGVKEVFATLWGDDTTESNIFSTLLGMQLYAEHGYARELSTEKLKTRFEFCTGARYEDFMNIKYLDETPDVSNDNMAMYNPSKYLLWQNILMGLYDKNIRGMDLNRHYEELGRKMKMAVGRNGGYGFVFELLEKLCSVLSMKAELGIAITDAYKDGNKVMLSAITKSILPELADRVKALRAFHRDLWLETNKYFGWEIVDARYGALLMDVDSAQMRINHYLAGKIECMEELEEARQYFDGQPRLTAAYRYSKIPSASRLSQ